MFVYIFKRINMEKKKKKRFNILLVVVRKWWKQRTSGHNTSNFYAGQANVNPGPAEPGYALSLQTV